MSAQFLDPDDLVDLTSLKKKKLQREWLTRNGYRFEVRADGRPAVLWSQVRARQGEKVDKPAEPNWDALR